MMSSKSNDSIQRVVPERSSVEKVSVTDLRTTELIDILAIWNEQRSNRLMPSRNDLLPRAIGRYLRHVSLLRVLPTEHDYELRIVGDVHVQAYGLLHQGGRISEIISEAPDYGMLLKASLDTVVRKREPIAYRGAVGRDVGDSRIIWLETAFLPLGNVDQSVDHVLNASVYVLKDGVWQAHHMR